MANDTSTSQGLGNGTNYENIDTSKTLTLADNGVVQNVIADAITITLPATTAGACFIIRNGGARKSGAPAGTGDDASVLVTVSPNASDKIQGLAFSAADDKDALNTKATARVGDYIKLVGDGTDGWNVLDARGIWDRQG